MRKLIFTSLITATFIIGCGGGDTSSDGGKNPDSGQNPDGNSNQQKSRGISHLFGDVENFQVDGNIINYAISPSGKYIYATTLSPEKLYVFSRDEESGKLTQIQSLIANDFLDGKEPSFYPQGIVVSPDGKQVYISASFGIVSDADIPFGNHLLRFNVNNLGQISYTNNLFVADSFNVAYNVKMTSDGDLMYIGANGSIVSAISRASNGDIGLLSEIKKDSNNNNFGNTRSLLLSPNNRNLYVSSTSFDGHLYTFDINQNSGELENKESFVSQEDDNSAYIKSGDEHVSGAGGTGMDISNDGKFFYSVGGYGGAEDSLSIFDRDNTGGLSHMKDIQAPMANDGSHRILFSTDSHLIISPNQKYIYTSDWIMETIGIWKRDINSGDLNYIGKKDDVDHSGKLSTSSDGKHLYINAKGGFVSYDLRADMDITVTNSSTTLNPSQDFSYTLTVKNLGPSNGDDVIVTSTLPTGVTYVSSSTDSPTGSCEVSGQVVTCNLNTLFTSAIYNITINAKAPATAGTITNQASVTANQLDTVTNNNDSSIEITVN